MALNENKNNALDADVSVIIVNHNTRVLLQSALQSVLEDKSATKEIIVVDNASVDGSVEMVQQAFPEVKLIVNKTNERFAKPNNDAIKISNGKYVFLLNSDASLYHGSLEKLVRYLDINPGVGACAPQLVYPDGSIQHSCRGYFTLWTHFCDMFLLDCLFPQSRLFSKSEMSYFNHKSIREVDHVMAAAILIRRQVINEIGMFDDNLTLVYNDLDWSMRVTQAGWKIVYFPEAQVCHHHSKTINMMNRQLELFPEIYSNLNYFLTKHYGIYWLMMYKMLAVIGFFFRIIFWFSKSLIDSSENTRYQMLYSWAFWKKGLVFWKMR